MTLGNGALVLVSPFLVDAGAAAACGEGRGEELMMEFLAQEASAWHPFLEADSSRLATASLSPASLELLRRALARTSPAAEVGGEPPAEEAAKCEETAVAEETSDSSDVEELEDNSPLTVRILEAQLRLKDADLATARDEQARIKQEMAAEMQSLQRELSALKGDTRVLHGFCCNKLETLAETLHTALSRVSQSLKSKREEEHLCKVCLTSEKEVILRDCGHFALCFNCADRVEECPICRVPICTFQRVFIA
jgi:hypothetical protein